MFATSTLALLVQMILYWPLQDFQPFACTRVNRVHPIPTVNRSTKPITILQFLRQEPPTTIIYPYQSTTFSSCFMDDFVLD